MKLHVEVHDGGAGESLLLVHGFLSSRLQWQPNLEGLRRRFRLVVVELWGHGQSPTPDDPLFYLADSYIDQFDGIRRELSIGRWFVCGQSFGAGLTIRYAIRRPEHTIGQIFTNSMSALSSPMAGQEAADRLTRADILERKGLEAIEALPFHPKYVKRVQEDVKQSMLAEAALISPSGIANAIRYTAPQLSVADRLGELSVPGLLVNGLWEKSFQPLRAKVAKLMPALDIVDLEGGHAINMEAPELFNDALIRFAANRS